MHMVALGDRMNASYMNDCHLGRPRPGIICDHRVDHECAAQLFALVHAFVAEDASRSGCVQVRSGRSGGENESVKFSWLDGGTVGSGWVRHEAAYPEDGIGQRVQDGCYFIVVLVVTLIRGAGILYWRGEHNDDRAL